MAGTRLAVHSIFVVQLICLVAASFLYASTKPFDPSSSAEQFISDQSGWKILVEDVSPVPLHDSVWEYVRNYLDVAVGQVNKLLGIMGGEEQHVVYHRQAERRTSVFVQQMREQISKLPLKYINNDDKSVVLPQLKMNFHMPMSVDVQINSRVASELEGAMRGKSTTQPSHGIILATSKQKGDSISCEEWVLPETTTATHRKSRKLRLPDIYLLTGCKEASIDVPDSDAIVIRATHADNDIHELKQYLQAEIAPVLLKIAYPAATAAQKEMHRIERIFVQLIDEDPSSHGEGDSKVHFDLLSKALSSSLQSTISPIINDLSFIYGGHVELLDDTIFWKDAIDLSSVPSAYLSLSNDIIDIEVGRKAVNEHKTETEAESGETGENESLSKKFVTTEQMSKFIQRHSSPNEGVEWFLLSPSKDHSPLAMRDRKSGSVGQSMILSDSEPTGVSLVQIDDDKYINSLSHSLTYLVGYIRELNGLQSQSVMEACAASLSSMTPVNCMVRSKQRQSVSFWELESIAQRHWYSVLQQVLHEMDAVMSLLHEHGSTLALPEHVVKKINTATHLLRESISFVENGFPVIYATSALYGALTTIESVQADADLFELSYFAPDHYLAVFSPLVLPLVMPMIFGLIKEVKRYKELTRKKQI